MEEKHNKYTRLFYRGPSRKSHVRNLILVLTVLMVGSVITLSYSLATGGALDSPENRLRPAFIATHGSVILLYLLTTLCRRRWSRIIMDDNGLHYYSPFSRFFDWKIAFSDVEKVYADVDDESALLYIHHSKALSRQIRIEEWATNNAEQPLFSPHLHPLFIAIAKASDMGIVDNTTK